MQKYRGACILGAVGISLVLVLIAMVARGGGDSEPSLESDQFQLVAEPGHAAPRRGSMNRREAGQATDSNGNDGETPVVSRLVLEPAIRGYVITPGGRPIPNAQVALSYSGQSGTGGELSVVLGQKATSADGTFVFSGTYDGLQVSLRVQHPSFATHEQKGVVASCDASAAYAIQLSHGLDLLVDVVREDGVAVPDVELSASLMHGNGQTYSSDIERLAVADAKGLAVFRNLSVGRKLVLLRSGGWCARGIVVTVTEAADARVRLVVSEGRQVTGRVVDENGRGVTGAVVIPQTPQSPGVLKVDVFASTISGESGAFICQGLPLGFVSLLAEAEGYSVATGRPLLIRPQDSTAELVLKSCEQRRVDVQAEGGELPERYILLMTRGPDARGPQLRGALQLRREDRPHQISVPLTARSYFLHVLGDGFAPASTEKLRSGETSLVTIEVNRGAELSGVVLDPDERAVAGATVSLHRAESARTLNLLGGGRQAMPMSETKTDSKGEYSFDRIPSGVWKLSVRHGGFAPLVTAGVSRLTVGDQVKREPITLSTGGGIRGQVKGPNGQAAPRAVIRLFRWGQKTGALTVAADKDGRFALDRIPAGRYRIHLSGLGGNPYDSARGAGGNGNPLEVTVVEGELVTISIP